MNHLLAVLVRPAEGLDDETLATVQAVGQVLLMAGLEMLRVQRRDSRGCCRTKTETLFLILSNVAHLSHLKCNFRNIHQAIQQVTFPEASFASTYPKQAFDPFSHYGARVCLELSVLPTKNGWRMANNLSRCDEYSAHMSAVGKPDFSKLYRSVDRRL